VLWKDRVKKGIAVFKVVQLAQAPLGLLIEKPAESGQRPGALAANDTTACFQDGKKKPALIRKKRAG